jgi:hypothetical protein
MVMNNMRAFFFINNSKKKITIRGKIFAAIASKREFMRLVPSRAIQVIQDVMEHGERKGKTGWRNIPVQLHLEHAKRHIELYFAGDRSEPHLRHAFCRLMMAVIINESTEEVKP